MRNLKRVLSLVMAAAMLVGLLVVSASAASTYDNFTDKDEIVNTEAVNTMVSLGVIAGKEDGSYFDPTGIVTRAEMAKLIAVCLNGGKDPLLGTGAATTQFTDVASNYWAAPYIAYCANLGIINGKGDGTFGPEEAVTGTAAAKMMLTALGYRSDIEGLTGTGWDLNTDSLANKVGLYDDMSITPSNGLSRDDTAQLIYNGVQADEVEYRNNYGEYSGVIYAQPSNGVGADAESSTMLWIRFKVQKVEGVVEATDLISLNNSTTVEGKSRLVDVYVDGDYYEDGAGNSVAVYPVDIDDELLGQRVVLYVKGLKDLAPNASSTEVVSEPIVSEDNTVVDTAARLKEVKDVRDVLKGSGISVANDKVADGIYITWEETVRYTDNGVTGADSYPGLAQRFIDNNADGTVDVIIRMQDALTKVNTYNETTEKMNLAGIGSVDFEDVLNPEDVAAGDYVLVYNCDDTYVLKAVETVSGEVEEFVDNSKDGFLSKITVDGTDYGWGDGVNLTSDVLDKENTDGENLDDLVDGTYTLYLDTHGNMLGYVEDEGAIGDYAVITGVNSTGNTNGFYAAEVKVIMADGTTGKFDVNLLASANKYFPEAQLSGMSNGAKEEMMYLELTGDENKDGTVVEANSMKNTLVSYSISDNTITLIDPDVATKSYFGASTGTALTIVDSQAGYGFTKEADNTAVSLTADERTVFFFCDEEDQYSTVSGLSNIKSGGLESQTGETSYAIYYQPEGNRAAAARAIFVQVKGEFTSSSNYAYVYKDYRESTVGNDTVYTYGVVFEDGETGTLQTKTTINGAAKEKVHEYQNDGSYVNFGTDDNVVNARRVTGVGNGSITTVSATTGGGSMSYVTSGAQFWDVQDVDNGVAPVSAVGIGDLVALVLKDDKVRTAFVYDHVDEELTKQPTGGNITVPGSSSIVDKDGDPINVNDILANGGEIYWNDAPANSKLVLKPTLPALTDKTNGVFDGEYTIDGGEAKDFVETTGIEIPAAADGQDQARKVTVTLTYAEYMKDENGAPTDEKITEDCTITWTVIITGASVDAPEAVFTDVKTYLSSEAQAQAGTIAKTQDEDGNDVENSWTLPNAVKDQRVMLNFADLSGVDKATVTSVAGETKNIVLKGEGAVTMPAWVYSVTGEETEPVIVTVKFEKAGQLATEVEYTIIVKAKAQVTLNIPGVGAVSGYVGQQITETGLAANSAFKVGDTFVDVDASNKFTMPSVGGDVEVGYYEVTIPGATTDLFDDVTEKWTVNGVEVAEGKAYAKEDQLVVLTWTVGETGFAGTSTPNKVVANDNGVVVIAETFDDVTAPVISTGTSANDTITFVDATTYANGTITFTWTMGAAKLVPTVTVTP